MSKVVIKFVSIAKHPKSPEFESMQIAPVRIIKESEQQRGGPAEVIESRLDEILRGFLTLKQQMET